MFMDSENWEGGGGGAASRSLFVAAKVLRWGRGVRDLELV